MKENRLSIVGGTARGRKLLSPTGLETRPTSRIVKEAMMNIIQFEISGAKVLDLYAGSGQLGLEALSRGALHATFVDQSPLAIKIIKANATALGFASKTQAIKSEGEIFLQYTKGEYDIVFLDPPYGKDIFAAILPLIVKKMHPRGIIICESEESLLLPDGLTNYIAKKDYKYGKRKITVYRGTE